MNSYDPDLAKEMEEAQQYCDDPRVDDKDLRTEAKTMLKKQAMDMKLLSTLWK